MYLLIFFSLCFVFCSFTRLSLGVALLEFILLGIYRASTAACCHLSISKKKKKSSQLFSLNVASVPCSFLPSGLFTTCRICVLYSFLHFPIFWSSSLSFNIFCWTLLRSPIVFSAVFNLLLNSSTKFLISIMVF